MQKLFITILLIISSLSYGQDTSKVKSTKFEEFGSENGVLKKFESKKIGKIKGFTLYKKTVTNIETEKQYNAVEITAKPGFWDVNRASTAVIIDEDELPSLIKALKYFLSNVTTDNCKEECPFFVYNTYGGVRVSCSKTIGAYGGDWHIYIGRNSPISDVDLEPKEFNSFISLLESYK